MIDIPGTRSIEPRAQAVLEEDDELLQLVREAVFCLRRTVDATTIDILFSPDYESPDGGGTVFVAATTHCPADLRKAFESFEDCWWLDNCHRADGRLAVTVRRA